MSVYLFLLIENMVSIYLLRAHTTCGYYGIGGVHIPCFPVNSGDFPHGSDGQLAYKESSRDQSYLRALVFSFPPIVQQSPTLWRDLPPCLQLEGCLYLLNWRGIFQIEEIQDLFPFRGIALQRESTQPRPSPGGLCKQGHGLRIPILNNFHYHFTLGMGTSGFACGVMQVTVIIIYICVCVYYYRCASI